MIDCFNYCLNRSQFAMADSLEDELIQKAGSIAEMETELKTTRSERFGMVTISLNRAGSPVIEVLDKPGMKASIDREEALKAEINRIRGLFAQLNPIFGQAGDELVRFSKPTLKELAVYKQECVNKAYMLGHDLKAETAFRLTSGRTRNLDLQGVLEDPSFVQHQQQVNNTIKGLNEEAKKAEEYINKIEAVLRN